MRSDDERLRAYFLRRALEWLKLAIAETDPIRKLEFEAWAAAYWRIARGE